MAYSKDLIFLRDGQFGTGRVTESEYRIKSSFGTNTVKKSAISEIHFMRPDGSGYPPSDEIRSINGDLLTGTILSPRIITFTLASTGETFKIDREKILSLKFLKAPDRNLRGKYPTLA